ncbi:MAG: PIN domain-containing protein [Candidatus Pacearchaeota archaeon]
MEILLDTNFILSGIKQKIQLFEVIRKDFPEYKIVIPTEIMDELEKIKESKKATLKERESAELSLFLIKKGGYKNIVLGSKNVDYGIISYTIKNPDIIIATLDRELKEKIKSKIKGVKFLTIRQKKKLILEC